MNNFIYSSVLFGILWLKLKSSIGRFETKEDVSLSDVLYRLDNLERGFVFLDRDVNNGLEGGTAISTNNRILDGVANPNFRMKTVRSGYIGNHRAIHLNGYQTVVGNSFSPEEYVNIGEKLAFVTTVRSKNSHQMITKEYMKVINLPKTYIHEYRTYQSGGAGSASGITRLNQFKTDRLWRYDQFIIGRQLDKSGFDRDASHIVAPIAIMQHNIDSLDNPVFSCEVGDNVLSLELERELSNVFVCCDELAEITEAYLMCNFCTRDLGRLNLKRAKGYSYIEIPVDRMEAAEGKNFLIFRLKSSVRSLIYHQIGGI